MEFVVDIQGFQGPANDFVIKEMAVVALEADAIPSVYVFEPPYLWSALPAKYKSVNLWLQHNYHGINWNRGDIPYEEAHEVLYKLLQGAGKVYIKGAEKNLWLRKHLFHHQLANLDKLGCPSLTKLRENENTSCTNHKNMWSPHCAAYNTTALKTWLLRRNRDDASNEDFTDDDDTDSDSRSISFDVDPKEDPQLPTEGDSQENPKLPTEDAANSDTHSNVPPEFIR